MIANGSHVPGVDWDSFKLPPGTALRIDRPAEALRPFFPCYAVLDSDAAVFDGPDSWSLPGNPQLWIVLADGPITIQIRNRHYAPLGMAVLFGPTSRAIPVTSQGGVSIVIDISPVGWARWFDGAAEDYRDRTTPVDQLWPEDWVADLVEALYRSDRGPGVKALLDDFFLSCLPQPHPQEERVAVTAQALVDPAFASSGAVAAHLGISEQALLRKSRRFFGYGPKQLMRRARFLRAFLPMMMAGEAYDLSEPPLGYHDIPHFLRDGADFLGMTPRRFLAEPTPYIRAVLRARACIIGAPWAVLDPLVASAHR